MAAHKHLPVSPCLYQWLLLLSHFRGTWLRPILTSAACHSMPPLHFLMKTVFCVGGDVFWPVQPDIPHIHASLAFIHHELPPTQQMFRWGVLSSNLFYVDLLISDARNTLSSSGTDNASRHLWAASSHCLNLLLALCETAETQTCLRVALLSRGTYGNVRQCPQVHGHRLYVSTHTDGADLLRRQNTRGVSTERTEKMMTAWGAAGEGIGNKGMNVF